MIITRHAAQRFKERVHEIPHAKRALVDLYRRSFPTNADQRREFGVEMATRRTRYRRAHYFHPDRQCSIEVLLVIRDDCIVTVLIKSTLPVRRIFIRIGDANL